MFNFDDYYLSLQNSCKEMLSRYSLKYELDVMRGWCFGQMDSLTTMLKLGLINSSECIFLLEYIKSILSDISKHY